ncbi:MAG: GtrA family protein [Chloroflexi bacterium]|jgi:dolichol-phosphate mannosyltransferase|nr:GtrA family protein [Chloroflexota bacterium]MBT7082253.1 GtrA family protein [Chloroflexota bacterium]MBT7289544.1 GtrA family protein [Chloroflexota bacterium]
MINKKRLFRFCAIGGSGLVFNTGILYLLTDTADLYYMYSAIISGIFIGIYNYLGNHYWTFKDRKSGSHFTGGSKFIILLAAYYAYYYGFLYLLTSVIGLYYLLSSVLLVIIGFFLKYLLSGMWIWKNRDQDAVL